MRWRRFLTCRWMSFTTSFARRRTACYEARSERVHPGLDDKVLTAWNGMMMKAFAECGSHLNRPDWVAAAEANAEFLLSNMVVDGRLLRTWRDGSAKISGYLEDYAFFVDGLNLVV